MYITKVEAKYINNNLKFQLKVIHTLRHNHLRFCPHIVLYYLTTELFGVNRSFTEHS